jgi:HNH endonuclease/AP2 domain
MITQAILAEYLHYDPETGVFTRLKYSPKTPKRNRTGVAGGFRPDGYMTIAVQGQRHLAHRLAWLYVHGEWPAKGIDHINGNTSDNRVGNLRLADQSENNQNRRAASSRSKTGLLGASFDKARGKYIAFIRSAGKGYNLGRFDTAEQAHAAYVTAKRKLHSHSTL